MVAPAADGTFGRGDVQRVRLVEACDRAGLSAEAIAEAVAAGRLPLVPEPPQYCWSELRTETYGELAARLGIPFDVIRQTSAVWSVGTTPEDRTREDDETIFTLIGMIATIVDLDALTRIGRVYVDGLRRVAEAGERALPDVHHRRADGSGLTYGEALTSQPGRQGDDAPHGPRWSSPCTAASRSAGGPR